tara:strand:- start:489 stop:2528 length:2040 start_codon:yes stop_codon:yes gene_type:complete
MGFFIMDVTLPNGRIISGVPEGTSKEEIKAKAISSGLATEEDFPSSTPTPPPPPPTPESYADFVPQFLGDVPESLQPTESVTGNTVRQNLEEHGPTIGGITGSVLGMPLGPVGMVAGASLGSGLGSLGEDALKGEDLDVMEALKESGISLGIDVATFGLGKFVGKPIWNMIKGKLSKGTTPEEIVLKLAKGPTADAGTPEALAQSQEILMKEGLSLTPYAAKVGSAWDITKEGIARTGFLSKSVFVETQNKVKEVVRSRMRDIMNIDKSGVSTVTQSDVGFGLDEAFQAGKKVLQENYGIGLKEIIEIVSKSTFKFDGSLKRVLTKYRNSNLDSSGNLNSKLDEKTLAVIDKLEGLMEGVSSGNGKFLLEFDESLTKAINNSSNFGSPSFSPNTARELTELSKLVKGSIRNQIRKIDPKAARSYAKIRREYGEGMNTIFPDINSTFVSKAGDGAYGAIGRMFTLPNSTDNVKFVLKSLDRAYKELSPSELAKLPFKSVGEAKQAISRSYIERALPQASSPDFKISDYDTVAKALTDPTESARIKLILGKDFEAYKRTVNLMSDSAKKPESGLATLFQRGKEFAAGGGIIAGVASGAFTATTATLSAATILLGPRVLARIATNPKHVNQLIKLDQMGSKTVSYEALLQKASFLVNDIADEAYESGDLEFLREIGILGDYE